MKTTIEIADSIFQEAKHIASRDQTTLRALVEEGLRRILEDRKQSRNFKLRDVSFRGDGLQDGMGTSWEAIRDLAYEDHGS